MLIVDDNLAKVLVHLVEALGQRIVDIDDARFVGQLEFEAVLVEVVLVGDLPVELDAAVGLNRGIEPVGLVDRKEIRFVAAAQAASREASAAKAAADRALDAANEANERAERMAETCCSRK